MNCEEDSALGLGTFPGAKARNPDSPRAAGRFPTGCHASRRRITERKVQVGWEPEGPFVSLGNSQRGQGVCPRAWRGGAGALQDHGHQDSTGNRLVLGKDSPGHQEMNKHDRNSGVLTHVAFYFD